MSQHQPATCCLLPPKIRKGWPSPVTSTRPTALVLGTGLSVLPALLLCVGVEGVVPQLCLSLKLVMTWPNGVALFLGWMQNEEGAH